LDRGAISLGGRISNLEKGVPNLITTDPGGKRVELCFKGVWKGRGTIATSNFPETTQQVLETRKYEATRWKGGGLRERRKQVLSRKKNKTGWRKPKKKRNDQKGPSGAN